MIMARRMMMMIIISPLSASQCSLLAVLLEFKQNCRRNFHQMDGLDFGKPWMDEMDEFWQLACGAHLIFK